MTRGRARLPHRSRAVEQPEETWPTADTSAAPRGGGPRLSGGDVDADWGAAESTGEEAVGGSVATPDQDIVDGIGQALGVEQAPDAEVTTSEEILRRRDRFRWHLDHDADLRERASEEPLTEEPEPRGSDTNEPGTEEIRRGRIMTERRPEEPGQAPPTPISEPVTAAPAKPRRTPKPARAPEKAVARKPAAKRPAKATGARKPPRAVTAAAAKRPKAGGPKKRPRAG